MKKAASLKLLVVLSILTLLLSSCGSKQDNEVAVMVALTQTAGAITVQAPTETPEPVGVISGEAHHQAPPTPALTLFAINIDTGEWFTTSTAPSDTTAPFQMEVKAGTYTIFGQGIGYASVDGWSLGLVTVEAGQTINDINVAPPGQSDCGSMFGIPAAPDSSFAASAGPEEECMMAVMSGANAYDGLVDVVDSTLTRIAFAPGSTMSQTTGYIIEPMGGHHFVFTASKGQFMTVNLLTGSDAFLVIWGNNGSALLTDNPRAKTWSGNLPASQDYFIDVRSMSQAPVDYTLEVSISAIGSGQTTTGAKGVITGSLGYPESYVPPMHIVAFNQDTGKWYWQGTAENTYVYQMNDMPPGTYHVVAYTQKGLVGAYASVGDGMLIPLTVKSGEVAEANMNVWLERDNSYYPGSSDPVGW
jgi:hypothetical protein